MGFIIEDLDPHDVSEEIIEHIVDQITNYKLSDEDIIIVLKDVKKYANMAIKSVKENG